MHKAKAFTRESRFLVESRPERYWYQQREEDGMVLTYGRGDVRSKSRMEDTRSHKVAHMMAQVVPCLARDLQRQKNQVVSGDSCLIIFNIGIITPSHCLTGGSLSEAWHGALFRV